jgi:23S rRNA pseudouridine1911/1915/1917 synthase
MEALRQFGRQALHAFRLGLVHPDSGLPVQWEIPMAPDMATLIAALREARHE